MDNQSLVPRDAVLPAEGDAVTSMLARIRPEWQATRLVQRVGMLLSVDESSACQKLLNAAFHDLRGKVRILGLDLAGEVAALYKLPPVKQEEDLEDYSTARLIDLAYRIGILTRAEWSRMHRAYGIRRYLEH